MVNENSNKIIVINISRTILEILGTVSVLSIAVISPNAILAFDKIYNIKKEFDKKKLKKSVVYLKNKKYITTQINKNRIQLSITNKGRKRYINYQIKNIKIDKPKIWNRQWHLVIADIPEEKRAGRNVLRRTLKNIGFIQLQKSVWIYPYECNKEINYLKNVYDLKSYVKYLVVERVDVDVEETLLIKFNLPHFERSSKL